MAQQDGPQDEGPARGSDPDRSARLQAWAREHGVSAAALQALSEALDPSTEETAAPPAPPPEGAEDPWAGGMSAPQWGTGLAWDDGGGSTWASEVQDGAEADAAGAATWGARDEPATPLAASAGDGDGLPPGMTLLGTLGRGGMGEVWQVHEPSLGRTMALKVLRSELAADPAVRARFVAEARATAQLEHPGILPVHELGTLADGRPYFTMKQVRGHTLADVIGAVHRGEALPTDVGPGSGDWTVRRAVDVFRRVCETVAFAHARGAVHRDLKPDNVMVGSFGEVLVLDWGLVRTGAPAADGGGALDTGGTAGLTRMGSVSGTPRYMAPEQARGAVDQVGPPTDVWALGVILWELLVGRPAFGGEDVEAVLAAVRDGVVPALPDGLPGELAELVARCTAGDPGARPPTAEPVARAVTDWLDGARRRDRARRIVAEAQGLAPEVERLTAAAEYAEREADFALEDVGTWEPVAEKRAGWEAEDRAAALREEAEATAFRRIATLEGALTHAPDLPEALDALADWHRAEHARAEATGHADAATHHARQLARYDRGRHGAYLRGDGAVTLLTEPAGAEVRLHRYVERDRRLEPVFERVLGTTPLRAVTLPMGSWLLTLHHPEAEVVRYPVHLPRQHHWDGVPPWASAPAVVRLPPRGSLGPDEVYVPPGWFAAGSLKPRPQAWPWGRRWTDGWVVRRHPVTNREYLAFLDALVASGREADALAWVPQERSSRPEEPGPMCYGRRDDGTFALVPDADGDLWDPDWPVFLVKWFGAAAFAEHTAARTGQPWQLLPEAVWEKAARGVDGRKHPWGPRFDATFANVRSSVPARPMPVPVQRFPGDVSPYGVRGMAGNVREWTADRYRPEGDDDPSQERVLRGGCWFFDASQTWCCLRYAFGAHHRGDTIGFRIGRPWPG